MLSMPKTLEGQSTTHGIAKQSSIEKLYQQQVGSSINAESCSDVALHTS